MVKKKVRIHGPAKQKNYSYGHATAYVGKASDGFWHVNAATRRTMTRTYPTKYKTKSAAIKAAKAFVLKKG